ncbi:MAG: hypothetical protein QM749_14335 [Aquabacterium sp.]
MLGVTHQARNNLSADAQAGLQHLLGHALLGAEHLEHAAPAQAAGNDSEAPLYEARFIAQRAAVPYRASLQDEQGRLLCPKPTVWGTQTAVVVGQDGPIHTDRDGRGQEVIVAFIEGDIDRPVIVGTAYNGQGTTDAQGNDIAGGAATVTGNAPAWFPGSERQGELEGHAHTASLSGFKSQSLDASQAGGGAYSQLVFDDTPTQGRVLAQNPFQTVATEPRQATSVSKDLRMSKAAPCC